MTLTTSGERQVAFLSRLKALLTTQANSPPVQVRPRVHTREDLDELIVRAGFEPAADLIRGRVRPCLHVFPNGKADEVVGATRFGGLPDLPADAVWPSSSHGPLSFFGQINMADVISTGFHGSLPESGLLSIFAADREELNGAVLLTAMPATLVRQQAPSKDSEFEVFNTVGLRFEPGITTPSSSDVLFDQALLAHCPDADFDDLHECMSPPADSLGQLLGHAGGVFANLHGEVALAELGRPGIERLLLWNTWEKWETAKSMRSKHRGHVHRPWSERDDENVRWLLSHSDQVAAEIEQWQVLLSINSNHDMGFWINDANTLYVFIRSDALAIGDFSHVRVVATQS